MAITLIFDQIIMLILWDYINLQGDYANFWSKCGPYGFYYSVSWKDSSTEYFLPKLIAPCMCGQSEI
jgi:hypothetical protein